MSYIKLILCMLALALAYGSMGDHLRLIYWLIVSVYWYSNYVDGRSK